MFFENGTICFAVCTGLLVKKAFKFSIISVLVNNVVD